MPGWFLASLLEPKWGVYGNIVSKTRINDNNNIIYMYSIFYLQSTSQQHNCIIYHYI